MKVAVVGGAGFIGSHLVETLVERGDTVVAIDDLSIGKREFLSEKAKLIELHVTHEPACVERLATIFDGVDLVFNLAANPDARWSLADTFLDMRQNALVNWATLDAMRRAKVKKFVLASSGTVYGDIPRAVAEDHGPSFPISLYGASKVASEAYASAYAHGYGIQSWIYRFGNVIGPRGTHGIMLDLLKKLDKDKSKLEVLGDGNQRKPYLHVADCVAGMLFGLANANDEVNYFNLAPPDTIRIGEIAELVLEEVGLAGKTPIAYTGGTRGWVGDVAVSMLDPEKIAKLGWRVRYTSKEAVQRAVKELVVDYRAGRTGGRTD